MSPRLVSAAPPRTGERGAILLVVLILSVTISVLSMALVATAEVALRADANADELDRAERGARSGVEWAAAVAKQAGALSMFSRSVTLDTGVVVGAQARLIGSPRLVGRGNCNGAAVAVNADLQAVEATRPYALMSFADTNAPKEVVRIDGMAYLGEPNTPLKGAPALHMTGDLDLVSTTALGSGQVTRSAGATNYGVASLSPPVWDTTPFTIAGNWSVPYRSVTGTTTIQSQTVTGLLVANLGAGQTLTLDNVILNGTLVVPCAYPPLLEVLGVPTIQLRGTTIAGGSAETGNLAILATGCLLVGSSATGSVRGVCYVRELDGLRAFTATGKMLVRKALLGNGGPTVTFERPDGFVPDVPFGISWGSDQVMIRWLGRQ